MRPEEPTEKLFVRERQRSAEAGEERAAPRKALNSGEDKENELAVR